MIRIGLVGAASSRADSFARLLNVEQTAGERARITSIWSASNTERVREVVHAAQIPDIATSLHHLVDHVDAAIIVDRHGDLHAEHALPFLLDGKPVFIHTPFAIDLVDCRRMLAAARRSGTAITSCSALGVAPGTEAMRGALPGRIRLGQLAGPCDVGSPHGDLFFEAPHLIELAVALLGERLAGLQAIRAGNAVSVDMIWQNDTLATLGFVGDAAPIFHASLFGTEGTMSRAVTMDSAADAAVLDIAIEMFETGRNPRDRRHLLLPIVITHAIVTSLRDNGGWVDVAAMLDREIEALG